MGQRMPPICAWEVFRHWIKDQDLQAVITLHLSVLFIYYLDDPKKKKHPLGHPLNIR
jgi:hypothetical protein